MRLGWFLLLLAGLAGATAGADEPTHGKPSLPGEKTIPREALTDADCQECHGVDGYSVPSGRHGETKRRQLHIDEEGLRDSVHGKLECLQCHNDIEQLPHRKGDLGTVDCVDCHLSLGAGTTPKRASWLAFDEMGIVIQTKRYTHSIHADQTLEGNASCADCHTAHYVYPSDHPDSRTYRINSPAMCGSCHAQALKEYRTSIHGATLKTPWKGDSATCTNCHSAHRISEKEQVATQRVMVEKCGDCHQQEQRSYMTTTHGQLAWLGDTEAARCQDCHAPHTTHPVDQPVAKVSKENILDTCRRCHEQAGPEFTKFRAHADLDDYQANPELWWVSRLMVGIVILTLLFFYSHSMLWFWREAKSHPIDWVKVDGRSYPVRAPRVKHRSGKSFRRFSWQWRLNHWALALSVMTLVFSGMTVMYPGTAWAMHAVRFISGWETLGIIHRFAAVVFLLAVFGHGLAIIIKIARDPGFRWFGPDSLLPRRKDWQDMKGQLRWFFGKGEQPRFERWTYWEKFDYWAVYWGAGVIGLSGIILWFSDSLSAVLPGWVFNMATLAHGVEAFLAVMTLFVVHFFNNHLRPTKFPLDTVMFTGRWDLDEFKEERPAHFDRLQTEGRLEENVVLPPSRRFDLLSHALGFTLLGIGGILLVLVIVGFAQKGLV